MTLRKASLFSTVPSAFKNGSRFLAFLLSLTLAVPNSALALRPEQGGLEEPNKFTDQLANRLRTGQPRPTTAGMEEGGKSELQQRFQGGEIVQLGNGDHVFLAKDSRPVLVTKETLEHIRDHHQGSRIIPGSRFYSKESVLDLIRHVVNHSSGYGLKNIKFDRFIGTDSVVALSDVEQILGVPLDQALQKGWIRITPGQSTNRKEGGFNSRAGRYEVVFETLPVLLEDRVIAQPTDRMTVVLGSVPQSVGAFPGADEVLTRWEVVRTATGTADIQHGVGIITAFPGKEAPKFPEDPRIRNEAERQEAALFWNNHVFVNRSPAEASSQEQTGAEPTAAGMEEVHFEVVNSEGDHFRTPQGQEFIGIPLRSRTFDKGFEFRFYLPGERIPVSVIVHRRFGPIYRGDDRGLVVTLKSHPVGEGQDVELNHVKKVRLRPEDRVLEITDFHTEPTEFHPGGRVLAVDEVYPDGTTFARPPALEDQGPQVDWSSIISKIYVNRDNRNIEGTHPVLKSQKNTSVIAIRQRLQAANNDVLSRLAQKLGLPPLPLERGQRGFLQPEDRRWARIFDQDPSKPSGLRPVKTEADLLWNMGFIIENNLGRTDASPFYVAAAWLQDEKSREWVEANLDILVEAMAEQPSRYYRQLSLIFKDDQEYLKYASVTGQGSNAGGEVIQLVKSNQIAPAQAVTAPLAVEFEQIGQGEARYRTSLGHEIVGVPNTGFTQDGDVFSATLPNGSRFNICVQGLGETYQGSRRGLKIRLTNHPVGEGDLIDFEHVEKVEYHQNGILEVTSFHSQDTEFHRGTGRLMVVAISPDGKNVETRPSAGLEEAGVKIYEKDKLPELLEALGREAPAGTTHVVVALNNPQARLNSLAIDLYVHANVAGEAERLLSSIRSQGATIERIIYLSPDPAEANEALQAAAQSQAQGRSVIIALDKNLMNGLQMPPEHPVVLLLNLLTQRTIEPARLAAFLAQPKALANLILDLTSGSIQPVQIQGRDVFVLYA